MFIIAVCTETNLKCVEDQNLANLYDYSKYKFKYLLTKDPSEASSLEYIKQKIKQYLSLLC